MTLLLTSFIISQTPLESATSLWFVSMENYVQFLTSVHSQQQTCVNMGTRQSLLLLPE